LCIDIEAPLAALPRWRTDVVALARVGTVALRLGIGGIIALAHRRYIYI
jgi:hypothetical protein